MKALILLSSLPKSWSATVTVVSNSASNSKLKLDNIRDLILSEDVCRKSLGESSSSSSGSALSTETRGRSSQKGRNQGRGRSKSREKSKPKFWNDITCWNCQKRGHFINQCKAPRKNNNNKRQDNDQSANAATDGKSLDIIGKGDINIRTSNGSVWTLKNARHIPALKRNLISIGQLDDEGHYTTFGDGH